MMNKIGILVLVPALAVASFGCCKKGSDASSGASPETTATSTGATTSTVTAPAAKNLTWNMDRVCDNYPGLKITQISVVGTETLVKMKFTNPGKSVTWIQTSPPGTKETFFLENHDESKKFSLKRSEGIAVSPAKTTVKPGETVDFTIVFPAIDESFSPIDIHEGEVKKRGQTYWMFEKIQLK